MSIDGFPAKLVAATLLAAVAGGCEGVPFLASDGEGGELIASDGGYVGDRVTRSTVVVTSRGANLRGGPSTRDQVIDWAGEGARLEVVGDRGRWLEVRRSDDRTAWIAASLTRALAEQDAVVGISASPENATRSTSAEVRGQDDLLAADNSRAGEGDDLLPDFE